MKANFRASCARGAGCAGNLHGLAQEKEIEFFRKEGSAPREM